jgi:hypothetical protein
MDDDYVNSIAFRGKAEVLNHASQIVAVYIYSENMRCT